MHSPFQLKQTVIVTRKESDKAPATHHQFKNWDKSRCFFGEVVAINNGDRICVRRFNPSLPSSTVVTELQWINLSTDHYTVTQAIL